ncbi:DUF3558 domain-containing protein [Streptomyces sp. SID13031]|uniref:DUF3558 domain-containing protein n=1 Tax=Streptomyces sp. SID13031 TaxID=2706046 RepID=UPI0013CBE202|nr:DUF3558 domain-containing protein [Streptomyces sp. SID13031]NEA32830.1 DUF3558 domain-containing protein [Streptomyces sp. SID13031]
MRYPLLLLATALLVTGCAAEEPTTYGPTTAGPTLRPKSTGPRTPDPSLPNIDATTEPTAKPLCSIFTTAEITATLGLPVRKVVAGKRGPYVTCTWTTVKPVEGPGSVTITRGDGAQYDAFSQQMIAEAKSKKARGKKLLEGVGDEGFAIGASVSGVPIWYAVVQHAGVLTGVQVSGAGSKASVGTIKAFMIEVLARG